MGGQRSAAPAASSIWVAAGPDAPRSRLRLGGLGAGWTGRAALGCTQQAQEGGLEGEPGCMWRPRPLCCEVTERRPEGLGPLPRSAATGQRGKPRQAPGGEHRAESTGRPRRQRLCTQAHSDPHPHRPPRLAPKGPSQTVQPHQRARGAAACVGPCPADAHVLGTERETEAQGLGAPAQGPQQGPVCWQEGGRGPWGLPESSLGLSGRPAAGAQQPRTRRANRPLG